MKNLYDLFGWGYGVFTTHAGEHLNKTIKQCEANATNFDENRFHDIIHDFRIKQFFFNDNLYSEKRDIKCSVCNQPGHTRNNKSCPLHSSHPLLEFEDTDNEESDEDEYLEE